MPLPERVEDPRETQEQARHLHQAEGVSGGRRVHHGQARRARPGQPGELEEARQLVRAGQGEIEEPVHVLLVQVGPALGDLPQGRAALPEPAVEGALHVQLGGEKMGRERDRFGREAGAQGIAQGVGRIGRDDEGALARFGGGEGRGGGTGGLADAPLAAEEAEGGEVYGSSFSPPVSP